ncbi:MAG: hypothetical protein KIT59_03515 [Nitrosomonas sp.]|nr:hypothetical protein [Nitrosomonas sp.]
MIHMVKEAFDVRFYQPLSSRSALSVTIAPRLISCLRIKQPIAGLSARLDTWPLASSY